MARAVDREEVFAVTIPAGTLESSPTVVETRFNPGTVVHFEIVIPDGPLGLAGVRIAASGTQIMPTDTGAWYVSNNEVVRRDVYNWPNSGRLEVEGYNTGKYDHTFEVRYGVVENAVPGEPITVAAEPLALTASGELPGPEGALPPITEPPPSGEAEPPPETPPGEPPPEGETPSAPEGESKGETEGEPPSFGAFTGGETEGEAEGETAPEVTGQSAQPTTAGHHRKHGKGHHAGTHERTRIVTEVWPAGGWLAPGKRYTPERVDQGQDGITDWKGGIIAPGKGVVIAVLADKPFPAGFGPRYPVIRITTGRFAGHDWYVGHCTSAVKVGEHVHFGQVVAHADQGHREGGGWFEIGEARGGSPANTPMGWGARYQQLFTPLHRRRAIHEHVKVTGHPKRKPPGKHGRPGHGQHRRPREHPHGHPHPPKRKPPVVRHGHGKPRRHPATARRPEAHKRAPHPALHPPAPPPPARRAPAPPPPPPPRRKPAPARQHRRHGRHH